MRRDPEIEEAVRQACLTAAIAAWEEARMVGLCAEGAWEAAIGAIRSLDLDRIDPVRAEPVER